MAKQSVQVKNRVEKARVGEGVKRAALARLAGVDPKTIKRIEDPDENVSVETKHKVVKGFNKIKDKKREYTFEYLFPDGSGGS